MDGTVAKPGKAPATTAPLLRVGAGIVSGTTAVVGVTRPTNNTSGRGLRPGMCGPHGCENRRNSRRLRRARRAG